LTPASPTALQGLLTQAEQHFHAGRVAEAEDLFRQVLSESPRNNAALLALGMVLLQTDRAADALGPLRKVAKLAPEAAKVHANLGLAYLQCGDAAKAANALSKAVKLEPRQPELRVHLANALIPQGRYDEARGQLAAAAEAAPRNPGIRLNLGNVLLSLGDAAAAEQQYHEALRLDPKFAAAHASLGLLRQSQRRLENAVDCYRTALSHAPQDAGILSNLGTAYRELGRLDDAVEVLTKAAQLAPQAGYFANLAALLERAHRPKESRKAVEQALALDPQHPEARLLHARLAARADERQDARVSYESLIADLERTKGARKAAPNNPNLKTLARAKAELAGLHEKEGRYDAAMSCFVAANELNRLTNPEWRQETEAYLTRVRRVTAAVEGLDRDDWRTSLPDELEGPSPVFLVGFPRSGTTLLDQILDAHSRVSVLEEKTLIDELRDSLGVPEDAAPETVLKLPASERNALRTAYWQGVRRHADIGDTLLVDKLPLNLINAWFINALFPESKILVALRDPRDVCLSCFTNLFTMLGGLASFPTLRDSAELYAAVLDLWRLSAERLPLSYNAVRYEDLVADLEREARKIIAFLGLPWEDGVLAYREAAKRRLIVTPSYHQVVQPLYSTSIGRWRHFPAAIEEVLPILSHHLDALGYRE